MTRRSDKIKDVQKLIKNIGIFNLDNSRIPEIKQLKVDIDELNKSASESDSELNNVNRAFDMLYKIYTGCFSEEFEEKNQEVQEIPEVEIVRPETPLQFFLKKSLEDENLKELKNILVNLKSKRNKKLTISVP